MNFFSKTLAQPKYSFFDINLLAPYLAVLHFCQVIEGQHMNLVTGHKPLCSTFYNLDSAKSSQHLSILNEYFSDLSYIKVCHNIAAYCRDQFLDCKQMSVMMKKSNFLLTLKSFHCLIIILYDKTTSFHRSFTVNPLGKYIFHRLHFFSHPGIGLYIKLIKSKYYWPNM